MFQSRLLGQARHLKIVYSLIGISLLVLLAVPAVAEADLLLYLPGTGVVQADLLDIETFDDEADWERYSNPLGVELGVENGVYRAFTMNAGYVWGLNEQQHEDVMLEVEVTPLTVYFENAFGVMCRADTTNNGDGYYFMINGNGYYSIRMGQGDEVLPLVEWRRSNAIHRELDRNVIRALCVDDYLALYVNDELLAVVTDDTYNAGYSGLSVAAASNTDVDVAFDNLAIYAVTQP